jgi:hypothetical protein
MPAQAGIHAYRNGGLGKSDLIQIHSERNISVIVDARLRGHDDLEGTALWLT